MCRAPGRNGSICASISDGDDITGFCNCDGFHERVALEWLFYTIATKILHLPFWHIFVIDLEEVSKTCHRLVLFLATSLHTTMFLCGALVMWSEIKQWRGL